MKVFHPYIEASLSKLEQWLSEMARNGWKLTTITGWIFSFEPSEPCECQYVIDSCSVFTRKNDPDLWRSFHKLKNKYATASKPSQWQTRDFFVTDLLRCEDINTYRLGRAKKHKKNLLVMLVCFLVIFAALCIAAAEAVFSAFVYSFLSFMAAIFLASILFIIYEIVLLIREIKLLLENKKHNKK